MKAILPALLFLATLAVEAANIGPWVPRSSGTTNRLNSIVYGPNGFIAVGENGVIIRSADGISWQPVNSGFSETLFSITYGNGMYVAVGSAGIILRSSNGSTWNGVHQSPTVAWASVAFGSGVFMIGGDTGATGISTNAVDWTTSNVGVNTRLNAMLPGFFAGGDNGRIYHSTNGISWTLRHTDPNARPLRGGTQSPIGYVMVGAAGSTTRSALWTSPDGALWTLQNSTTGFPFNDAIWALDRFLAVGDGGLTATSFSLSGWTGAAQSGVPSLNGIAFGADRFVAVGVTGYVADRYYSDNILITAHPQNQQVYPWQNATFSVTAIGGRAPLQYQWYRGAIQIPGARLNVFSFEVRDTASEGNYRVVVSDGFTSVSSEIATLELLVKFVASLNKPTPGSVLPEGIPIPIEASVDGQGPVTNLSFYDGSTLLGSDNSAPYAISVPLNGLGTHSLKAVAYNDTGASSTSGIVNVTVVAPLPEFTAHPHSQSIFTGTIVTLESAATGHQPITWQWLKDGQPLANSQTNILKVNGTNILQAGLYQAVATGPYGSATSAPARLEVAVHRPDFYKMFHDHDPGSSSIPLHSLAYGDGTYVAVGGNGTIATSLDGVEWTDVFRLGLGQYLWGVVYAAGKFVAVGNGEAILVSTNGYSWSVRRDNGIVQPNLHGVAYGNGVFVSVGNGSRVFTSTDGETWTLRSFFSVNASSVVFHPTLQLFFAYAQVSGKTRIYSSPNGADWSIVSDATLGSLHKIEVFNSTLVALTATGIQTSPDGSTWTPRVDNGVYWFGTTLGSGANARYAAYREDGQRARSVDGVSFTVEPSDAPSTATAAIWGNGAALLVSAGAGIFGSLDGAAWSPVRANRWRHDIQEATFARDRFYLHGTSGSMPVGDGSHPVAAGLPITSIPFTAAFGANKYVVSAALGTIWHSDNSLSFTPIPGDSSITRLLFEENKFVGVGDTHAKYSTDGVTWHPAIATPGFSVTANDIAYGNDRFIAVHINNGRWASEDGITWQGPFSPTFSSIAFGKNVFAAVALGSNSSSYSYDGLNWKLAPVRFSSRAIHYADGMFISCNDANLLMYSLDGINWYGQSHPAFRGIAFGNDIWMITSHTGSIRQTGYGAEFPIPPQIVQEPSDLYLPNLLKGELRVRAVGADKLTYQWFKDSQLISKATNSVLHIPGGQNFSGAYYARIENNYGSVTTRTAQAIATGQAIQVLPATLAATSTIQGITITITGASGSILRLEGSQTLEPGSWSLIEEIHNPGGTIIRNINPDLLVRYFVRATVE